MSGEPRTIVCKAAVVMAAGQPFEIMEVNVAPPKRGEVRIRILYACPCHTDEITQRGVDPTAVYPCILGHESCGQVESIGEGVTTCKPGQKVIPLWEGVMPLDNTSRFTTKDGQSIYHFMGTSRSDGFMSLFGLISWLSAASHNTPWCLRSALPLSRMIAPWTNLGCVGLACVEGAHLAGAKEIICVDINDIKLAMAKDFGGTKFINPKNYEKPIQDVIIEMTNGGVDFAFECTGNTTVMRNAVESTCKGWGLAVIVGIGEAGKEISTRPYHFIVGRQLKGSVFGGWRSRDDVPKLAEKVINGELKLGKYCTHRMKFSQINEAFDLLKRTECIRCVMDMQQ
ncbi:alcohol dehydrogenase [Cyclospora cayetanensis]|uniref:Alcohol dehydrogenase n=1 Tax=Cyclospora cayetanensis TaxID=88456 RepID=A0A1D3CS11_9EIME|nr:alcohol dehydrogenase [Cyclospora cayetanensis]